jgi:hypothetical protein
MESHPYAKRWPSQEMDRLADRSPCESPHAGTSSPAAPAILVTDFVTPNWFAHQNSQGKIDLEGRAQSAFEVLTGDYAQKFDPQEGWVQVTGTKAALGVRANAAPGSRRERRFRQWKNWQRSQPKWQTRGEKKK